jgi:hypothetical protein
LKGLCETRQGIRGKDEQEEGGVGTNSPQPTTTTEEIGWVLLNKFSLFT